MTERLDTHEHAISDIIQQIMQLLTPPPPSDGEEPPRPRIGFSVASAAPSTGRVKPRQAERSTERWLHSDGHDEQRRKSAYVSERNAFAFRPAR